MTLDPQLELRQAQNTGEIISTTDRLSVLLLADIATHLGIISHHLKGPNHDED